jgi:hypothetical protein
VKCISCILLSNNETAKSGIVRTVSLIVITGFDPGTIADKVEIESIATMAFSLRSLHLKYS